MGRYAIVDGSMIVDNVIRYDPADEYDPGDGMALVELADDSLAARGDTIDAKGDVVAKGVVGDVAPVDKLDALIAKLVDAKVITADDATAVDEAAAGGAQEGKP